jgi:hypothetical protein
MKKGAAVDMLRRALSGEERLWKVWWLIGVPLWLTGNILAACVLNIEIADPDRIRSLALILFGLVAGALWIAWNIAAWRCAPNVGHSAWRSVARACLVVLALWHLAGGDRLPAQLDDRLSASLMSAAARAPTEHASQVDSVPSVAPAVASPAPSVEVTARVLPDVTAKSGMEDTVISPAVASPACVIRGSWTRVSREGGRLFRAKLDSGSAATRGFRFLL